MIIKLPATLKSTQRRLNDEQSRLNEKKPVYLVRKNPGRDSLEISTEAREKFHQNRAIDLNKERLKREAGEIAREIDRDIHFRESDLRKVYRLDKILEAREKLESGFYDRLSNEDLASIFKKPRI